MYFKTRLVSKAKFLILLYKTIYLHNIQQIKPLCVNYYYFLGNILYATNMRFRK